jgi:hypothetical protein
MQAGLNPAYDGVATFLTTDLTADGLFATNKADLHGDLLAFAEGSQELRSKRVVPATEQPPPTGKFNKTSQTATSNFAQPASSCLHYLDARHS